MDDSVLESPSATAMDPSLPSKAEIRMKMARLRDAILVAVQTLHKMDSSDQTDHLHELQLTIDDLKATEEKLAAIFARCPDVHVSEDKSEISLNAVPSLKSSRDRLVADQPGAHLDVGDTEDLNALRVSQIALAADNVSEVVNPRDSDTSLPAPIHPSSSHSSQEFTQRRVGDSISSNESQNASTRDETPDRTRESFMEHLQYLHANIKSASEKQLTVLAALRLFFPQEEAAQLATDFFNIHEAYWDTRRRGDLDKLKHLSLNPTSAPDILPSQRMFPTTGSDGDRHAKPRESGSLRTLSRSSESPTWTVNHAPSNFLNNYMINESVLREFLANSEESPPPQTDMPHFKAESPVAVRRGFALTRAALPEDDANLDGERTGLGCNRKATTSFASPSLSQRPCDKVNNVFGTNTGPASQLSQLQTNSGQRPSLSRDEETSEYLEKDSSLELSERLPHQVDETIKPSGRRELCSPRRGHHVRPCPENDHQGLPCPSVVTLKTKQKNARAQSMTDMLTEPCELDWTCQTEDNVTRLPSSCYGHNLSILDNSQNSQLQHQEAFEFEAEQFGNRNSSDSHWPFRASSRVNRSYLAEENTPNHRPPELGKKGWREETFTCFSRPVPYSLADQRTVEGDRYLPQQSDQSFGPTLNSLASYVRSQKAELNEAQDTIRHILDRMLRLELDVRELQTQNIQLRLANPSTRAAVTESLPQRKGKHHSNWRDMQRQTGQRDWAQENPLPFETNRLNHQAGSSQSSRQPAHKRSSKTAEKRDLLNDTDHQRGQGINERLNNSQSGQPWRNSAVFQQLPIKRECYLTPMEFEELARPNTSAIGTSFTGTASGPGSVRSQTGEGILNNQVLPGTRANNYWDNFRSFSRQNMLSSPKSNGPSAFVGSSTDYRPHASDDTNNFNCLQINKGQRPDEAVGGKRARNSAQGKLFKGRHFVENICAKNHNQAPETNEEDDDDNSEEDDQESGNRN